MPWINLTIRKGALHKETQHAVMGKLTEVLMWWEKVPNTPRARSIMKGWVYEVAEDADYIAGSPIHEKPFYFVDIRIPINRLDLLAKQGLIRDFTKGPAQTALIPYRLRTPSTCPLASGNPSQSGRCLD